MFREQPLNNDVNTSHDLSGKRNTTRDNIKGKADSELYPAAGFSVRKKYYREALQCL